MRGKSLMIQGTASNVGKSVLCSALLRIMKQDGLRCAPFKSQNMALNSCVTKDGFEMGRAQYTQAQAAGIEPNVRMNPILLKPTTDCRSQVIVSGRPIGNLTAFEYHQKRSMLQEIVRKSYTELENGVDCVVIEGAGSPAEINLREGDIANMFVAETVDAPVILVGDIDLGGVFASLLGTVMLLTEEERARVKGVIINKFRGDIKLLEPGIKMLEDRIHLPVLGVVPWMNVGLEDEDSVSTRFDQAQGTGDLNVRIIKLRHVSNFTDFQSLTLQPGAKVQYAFQPEDIDNADLVILPGTKNTMEDLDDLRSRGMDAAILQYVNNGGMLVGICGGYQMLGQKLFDPKHVEPCIPEMAGLGLLDMTVTFAEEKQTQQVTGVIDCTSGWLSVKNGLTVDGYEIHAGVNEFGNEAVPWLRVGNKADGITNAQENVLGSYIHGLFDDGQLFAALSKRIREIKGMTNADVKPMPMDEFREHEFDRIADIVRASVDMDRIYRIIRGDE